MSFVTFLFFLLYGDGRKIKKFIYIIYFIFYIVGILNAFKKTKKLHLLDKYIISGYNGSYKKDYIMTKSGRLKRKSLRVIRQRRLKRLITYNPLTGEISGGGSINIASRGYLRMRLKCKDYYLQQLAWIYVYGKLPVGKTIGFRDRDKTNLKLDNLYVRAGTVKQTGKSNLIFKGGSYVKA